MLPMKYLPAPEGWFYSETFNYWQKTNKRVVCYVSQIIGGYQAQLYIRGDIFFCELEARIDNPSEVGFLKMFEIGSNWLSLYESGELPLIHLDDFSIRNPQGFWRERPEEKRFWVKL